MSVPFLPLQAGACTGVGGDYMGAIGDGSFIAGFLCPYIDVVGLLGFGLLVYSAIGTTIYIRTGSVVIPFVLLIMIGGPILSQVASIGVAVATVVILLVLGGVPLFLVRRYSEV
jgi:hypothetical protein